ncbi:MAG: CDP-glycerol glycerophosphotransferase family protein [Oscillospiraceae bacterium]|nr:CDP-glycerol glycerophosphotransferase family protein [Oscillospiraceae bacterium]
MLLRELFAMNLGDHLSTLSGELFRLMISHYNHKAMGADAGKVFFDNIMNGPLYTMSGELFRVMISHLNHRAVCMNTERNIVITCDLILEEDTSPQDEYALFCYLYGREKESGLLPYYIMNEHSPEYENIKSKYGDRIIPYSRENHRGFAVKLLKLLTHTKFICSGFQVMHALNIGLTDAVKKSPYVYLIFTQHGVNFFKDNFISQSAYSSFLFDRIMISNDFEKNLFIERGCYDEKALIKNGLFRWDLLSADNAESEKSIFIYFTHRRYLKDMENIEESAYVKAITGLLKDERFTRLVKEKGYTVKVAVHHTVLSVCGKDILEGIHILEDAEIAEAKKTSAILITDYSSMCFEMWFQHKPVIFMNIPDSEDCTEHGHKTDLPAPYEGKEDYIFNVVDTKDQCIDLLKSYMDKNFAFTEEDKRKRDRFFYYNSDFRKRFCEYLISMKNEKKDMYRLRTGDTVIFSRHSDIYTEGIHFPDSEGRWIVFKNSVIRFYISDAEGDVEIKLTGLPHPKSEICGISLSFSVNGRLIKKAELRSHEITDIILPVPKELIGSEGEIDIRIKAHNINGKEDESHAVNVKSRLSFKLFSMDIIER